MEIILLKRNDAHIYTNPHTREYISIFKSYCWMFPAMIMYYPDKYL